MCGHRLLSWPAWPRWCCVRACADGWFPMSVDMACLLLPTEVSLCFFICWYVSVLLILYVYELAQTHSVLLALCICCMNLGNWHQSVIMLWIGVVPDTVIVFPCLIAPVWTFLLVCTCCDFKHRRECVLSLLLFLLKRHYSSCQSKLVILLWLLVISYCIRFDV